MEKYTESYLRNLKAPELKKIAKSLGIKYTQMAPVRQKIILKQIDKSPELPFQGKTDSFQKLEKKLVDISTFIIQINKSILLDFFGCALIYPVNYEIRELARNQRTKDIQYHFRNHLLISDGFTDEADESQVLIEVSLSEFDKQNLFRLNEKIYLLPYPLPISRVKKIYFATNESQQNSIASANTFQDAYLPIQLFDVWNKTFESRINLFRENLAAQISTIAEVKTDCQNKFNRILGMLAFMKNAELYYANETYKLNFYSEAYFKVLREINPFFTNPEIGKLEDVIKPFYLNFINPRYQGSNNTLKKIVNAVYNNEIFRKDIFVQILGVPTEEVKNAFNLLVSDQTLEALKKMKEPELILLAFLYRFRDKEGSDKYALKEQLAYLISRKSLKTAKTQSRASIVLAVLGLYYGYRSLPKDDEIKLNDSFFASFNENGKFNIKYKLDNLLDRITIESVYQYSFWNNQKNEFDFLKDDKYNVKLDLKEGYSDQNTFSIVENYPIIKISKQHSALNKKVKKQTDSAWTKVNSLLDLFKKNGLVQGEVIFDRNEFDVWLHNNSTFELEKLLSEFNTYTGNEPTNHNE